MTRSSDIVESLAIAGAAACLAHCLAVPLGLAMLPMLASVAPVPFSFHLAALVFAVPTTALALWLGHRRHRGSGPLLAGGVGLTLLALGTLRFGSTALEVPVTIAGSLAIVAAHLANWRRRRPMRGDGPVARSR